MTVKYIYEMTVYLLFLVLQVYEEIRNAFFSSVFVTLKEKARQLQAKKVR